MSLLKKNSDFWRRLRFYGLGLLMGSLLVSVITKGRACQMPGTVKLQELYSQYIAYDEKALCKMQCVNMDKEELQQLLKTGDIDYGKSEANAKPCQKFVVESKNKKRLEVFIMINDCDTASRVVDIDIPKMKMDSCKCN